jgi:hypothetical protein
VPGGFAATCTDIGQGITVLAERQVRDSPAHARRGVPVANKYKVSGVPHTVIGDSPQTMIGAYPEAAAADMLVAIAQGMRAI